MAQTAEATRRRIFLLFLALATVCGAALAQDQPYLLLQGPSSRSTYCFAKGTPLEWRLAGEDELFVARITDLFPESQAVRLEDLIVSLSNIESVRFPRRGAGLRTYAVAQGSFNLAVIGVVSLAGGLAGGQKNFAIGSAAASGAMVLYGLIGRRRTRKLGANSSFVLTVAGGDITKSDDPDRG